MQLNNDGVNSALSALSEYLDYLSSEPIEIVVCGGSALQALSLVTRVTRDVDVLALVQSSWNGTLNLISSDPLPDVIMKSAAFVARDLMLPDNWFNSGPSDLVEHGLPEGITNRFHTRRYGPKLTVHFIGRLDQICFKTYASVCDGEGSRHLADLLSLIPTDEEMLFAASWCLTQDASDSFPQFFNSFLVKAGFQYAAEKLDTKNEE